MSTTELFDQAIALVARLGYTVRQEYLADSGGGCCELNGRKLFFVDLDLGPDERLEQVLEMLRREPAALELSMPRELQELVRGRKGPSLTNR